MKLIVGLGNPGEKYENTRHNAGFLALDNFSQKYNIKFKYESKFEGFIGELSFLGEKVLFLKPLTYMNLSGNSVIKVINYFKIPLNEVLVIYDDVDIELGHIRLRKSGSSGGHKGIKSIIEHFKSEDFKRIRIGISKGDDIIDYVLARFSQKEKELLNVALENISEAIRFFIIGKNFEQIMNQYN